MRAILKWKRKKNENGYRVRFTGFVKFYTDYFLLIFGKLFSFLNFRFFLCEIRNNIKYCIYLLYFFNKIKHKIVWYGVSLVLNILLRKKIHVNDSYEGLGKTQEKGSFKNQCIRIKQVLRVFFFFCLSKNYISSFVVILLYCKSLRWDF